MTEDDHVQWFRVSSVACDVYYVHIQLSRHFWLGRDEKIIGEFVFLDRVVLSLW